MKNQRKPVGREKLYEGCEIARTTVTFPGNLIHKIDAAAQTEGISRSSYIARTLAKHLGEEINYRSKPNAFRVSSNVR